MNICSQYQHAIERKHQSQSHMPVIRLGIITCWMLYFGFSGSLTVSSIAVFFQVALGV